MISSLDLIDGRGPGFPAAGGKKNLGLFFPSIESRPNLELASGNCES